MAAYRIEIKKSVLKDLGIYSKNIYSKLFQKIESLSHNPRPNNCKKLRGSSRSYRIRVGDYRRDLSEFIIFLPFLLIP